MDRRTFLARLAIAAAVPAAFRLRDAIAAESATAASAADGITYESALTTDERRFVDALAEGILPATDTPGARAAKVPEFIAMMFDEWMLVDEQRAFRAGLAALASECSRM